MVGGREKVENAENSRLRRSSPQRATGNRPRATGNRESYPARVADTAAKRATWEDLEALPDNVVGELIRGVLHVLPRPRALHADAEVGLVSEIAGAYRSTRRGGPGGWWILVEPGIGLPALDVAEIVPDIAGWRRERMPELPEKQIAVAPDWVCEILSPSTRRHDLLTKRPLYAEAGVTWMWIVDLDARTLTASRNHEGKWLELGVWSDADLIRAEPFDQVELRGEELWGVSP